MIKIKRINPHIFFLNISCSHSSRRHSLLAEIRHWRICVKTSKMHILLLLVLIHYEWGVWHRRQLHMSFRKKEPWRGKKEVVEQRGGTFTPDRQGSVRACVDSARWCKSALLVRNQQVLITLRFNKSSIKKKGKDQVSQSFSLSLLP